MSVRQLVDQIGILCEEIENEQETPNAEPGWYRGRKYTAKQIRKFAYEAARNIEDNLSIYKYGH